MLTRKQIEFAAENLKGKVRQTELIHSPYYSSCLGVPLHFKCENLQKTGAFKLRGAMHATMRLSDQAAAKGVATHSSGNHAAALAYAARMRGIPAYVVMPETAPQNKIDAVEEYGGVITFCRPTLDDRERTLEKIRQKTGATFIHPYNNADVIAGQGTACLELLQQIPDILMPGTIWIV